MPSQVKLIPVIKQSEIARYYKFADAVITNLFIGTHESVCVESVLCGTPVIQYTNRKIKIIVDEREIKSPFLPFSNDPKLFEEEYKFVKEICDPVKCGEWWDNLFVDLAKKHKSIKKNSSPLRVKLRLIYFLIVNRLYSYKLKRLLTGSYEKTGQTIYDNPPEIQRTNQSKE
jgi:hypothetical protein